MGCNRLLAAYRAELFTGLGFYSNPVGRDIEDGGQASDNAFAVGPQLGVFGEHDAIDVADLPSGPCHRVAGGAQHLGRVAIAVGRVRVGKHLTDVAQGGRSQQRIRHGVEQHVGVAVAEQSPIVGNRDPTQA